MIIDYVQIVNQALGLLAVALVGYGLKLAGDYLKTRIPADLLEKAAALAVTAVEQMDKAGILGEVESKKKAALDIASRMIEAELAARGLKMTVDLNVVADLIEAKVWELINSTKTPEGEG